MLPMMTRINRLKCTSLPGPLAALSRVLVHSRLMGVMRTCNLEIDAGAGQYSSISTVAMPVTPPTPPTWAT